jgi:hypothetical protein
MTFKNDTNGTKVLNWWRNACLDWCYARHEDGKFGDQKYLDDWTKRFEGIHVLQNLGGGVAPWNVQQYDLKSKNFHLIFYHFHNYKLLENNKVELGKYKVNKDNIEILYKPYTKHLDKISKYLAKIDKENDFNGIVKKEFHWKDPLTKMKRYMKGTYNIFSKNRLLGE